MPILTCTFASGCCHRHPISCRDASKLQLPAAGRACNASSLQPVYMRPGKTGSKFVSTYLSSPGPRCAQLGPFHDTLASSLPRNAPKLAVLREPCSRALSLIAHWRAYFAPTHPVQRVASLADLATFLDSHWTQLTALPWPETDAARHHYIVGWPQSWYVDNCTRILCFDSLEPELERFCHRAGGTRIAGGPRQLAVASSKHSSGGGGSRTGSSSHGGSSRVGSSLPGSRGVVGVRNGGSIRGSGSKGSGSGNKGSGAPRSPPRESHEPEACARIRNEWYAEDWRLYQRHCVHPATLPHPPPSDP